MIDPSDIGQLTLRFLDHIRDDYGDDATLLRTMIISEVRYPDEDDPETIHTQILWDTDERSVAAKVGLVSIVQGALLP